MFHRIIRLIPSSILVLFLGISSACSTLPEQFDKDSSLTTESSIDTSPQNELQESQVIEALVSEAADLGEIDIDGREKTEEGFAETSEAAETLIHIVDNNSKPEIQEPVTPTIAMTANRVVELAINDYLQNRQTLLRLWIERSNTYFPMIEQVFKEEGIPDELKYIALGESNLSPTARSAARATGMWQFMAATGRGAGLEINTWVDERRDPEKSSRAAAQHLKELYKTYNGSWHLALAGYNCSYRCISRAVRRAGGSIENPPSFWEIYPYLPRETRGFIPKFIAASLLVSNPEMYGISADTFGEELAYDIVEITGMLSLDDAATLSGINSRNLNALNPELIKNSLPDSNEPYPLKIPLGSYQNFVDAFNDMPEENKIPPSEYIVSSGDTLGRIARKFETSVEELQAVNSIRGHLIHPKQKLLIPGTGISTLITVASTERQSVQYGEAAYLPIKLTDEFQLVELDGSTEENPLIAVSLSEDVIDDFLLVPTVYQVRRGDTLGQIAQQFSVSIRNIQDWNNIRGSLIRVGQELTIHTGASAPRLTTYEVKRGDNLGSIARRFGVSIANLKSWNGLTNDIIFPGQNLQLN